MVVRHLEKTKMTGASLGFGKTLLGASYKLFLMSVLTSMYDPGASTLAVLKKNTLCKEEELNDMREDAKKKEEHLYPAPMFSWTKPWLETPLFKFVLIHFKAALHSIFRTCDDCLPVLSDPEEDFQPVTPSDLDLPTNAVVTFLSPISSPSKKPSDPD